MLIAADDFAYVKGAPKTYRRSDLDNSVTREFCGACGTHLATRRPDMPHVILKIGSLDDTADYGGPQAAIFTIDRATWDRETQITSVRLAYAPGYRMRTRL